MDEETMQIQMGSSTPPKALHGYSLWEFSGQQWNLKKDVSVTGAIAVAPPRQAGLFTGQIRAVPSILK